MGYSESTWEDEAVVKAAPFGSDRLVAFKARESQVAQQRDLALANREDAPALRKFAMPNPENPAFRAVYKSVLLLVDPSLDLGPSQACSYRQHSLS